MTTLLVTTLLLCGPLSVTPAPVIRNADDKRRASDSAWGRIADLAMFGLTCIAGVVALSSSVRHPITHSPCRLVRLPREADQKGHHIATPHRSSYIRYQPRPPPSDRPAHHLLPSTLLGRSLHRARCQTRNCATLGSTSIGYRHLSVLCASSAADRYRRPSPATIGPDVALSRTFWAAANGSRCQAQTERERWRRREKSPLVHTCPDSRHKKPMEHIISLVPFTGRLAPTSAHHLTYRLVPQDLLLLAHQSSLYGRTAGLWGVHEFVGLDLGR